MTGGIGGGEGGPLGAITGIIGGITGGIGGGEGGPLGSISDILGGITGGIGGGEGGPLGGITGIIGGITGGIGGGEGGPLGSISDILSGITGGIGGGEGGPLGSITGIISGITGGIGGEGGLSVITDILGTINNGANSGDVIAGIAQPIQTVISSGNIAVDALQDHVSTLFSDGSLESINNLISVSVGNGDYSAHGSLDGILDALTGTVTSGIAVGEPNPNGGSLTDLISLPSALNNLTDHLFSSVNHF
ncbi:hypothetical protein F909_00441 [Acinetobacter sp. ANC 3929]|nr:hypothetical protein F909_00441 [Acinetobacter sp. ANC 3929]